MFEPIILNVWEVREGRKFLWYFWFNEKWRQLVKVKCLKCWEEKIITKATFLRNVQCKKCKQKELTKKLNEHQTTHWLSKNKWNRPLYDIYMWILGRCYNPNNHAYNRYWWRWITCEWNNVEDFVRDMWDSYYAHCKKYGKKNTSLDRIDNNWNYSKDNCKWATYEEQANNTRRNIFIIINWIKYNSIKFAEKFKVSKATASHRICWYLHGRYSLEQIMKEWTKFKKNIYVEINWKKYYSNDIVKICWCHRSTAIHRIHKYLNWKIDAKQLFS